MAFPSMTKLVNIKAPIAIRTITPPIYGTCNNVIMTTGDILKCICKRAIVEEILPDGSTIRLNTRNYYTDNGAGLDAKNRPRPAIEDKKPSIDETSLVKEPTLEVVDTVIDDKVPEAPYEEEAQVVETTKTEENVIKVEDDLLEEDNTSDSDDEVVIEDYSDTSSDDAEDIAEEAESSTDTAPKPVANNGGSKKNSSKKKKK